MNLDDYLAEARTGLARVEPADLWTEVARGAILIDTRTKEQRDRDGELQGALVIGLNQLEWRVAPSSPWKTVDISPGQRVILVCDQGYSSSLAADRLRRLDVPGATDLIDGFKGLMAAGLTDPGQG